MVWPMAVQTWEPKERGDIQMANRNALCDFGVTKITKCISVSSERTPDEKKSNVQSQNHVAVLGKNRDEKDTICHRLA